MKKITLKAKRDASLKRFHPWVFSGAIAHKDAHIADGDIVEVFDNKGTFLATGHFQDGSIQVRAFSFQPTTADHNFWYNKLKQAWVYRQALGLIQPQKTNCFRLIHGEGDGLPGLVIDIYARTAVIQCHSVGMHRQLPELTKALQTLFVDVAEPLLAIYSKSARALPKSYSATVTDGYQFGKPESFIALENGLQFHIDWEAGQKTGFFLDQRDNRALLGNYAGGRKIANTFCYTGGFSLYAQAAEAQQLDSVDVSARAMELTQKNVALNFGTQTNHRSFTDDVLSFLRTCTSDYDILVVDPPAFAKNIKKRHQAVQGYKRLNALALKKIKAGGLVFTFSCSQVVDQKLFENTIVAAAVEAGRQASIVHRLNQPPDHPVSLFHPEGNYLKGLVLYVH
ncbi:MAG: class I SAM-dependent rRNA methyltransferase [Saprospiraceae bacterium]|nr:class I SAM-dependent rRNA methyltransferase [Saprospiraceae bacterium]